MSAPRTVPMTVSSPKFIISAWNASSSIFHQNIL